jgi:DNA-binding MltR family transcriptional regulator
MTVKEKTLSAERLITKYQEDPKVAVILAATFVHTRLRTIVKEYLKQKDRAKVVVVDDNVDLKPTLKLAYALGVITFSEFSKLSALAKSRNRIAHKSKFWIRSNSDEKTRYLDLSGYAATFLKSTGSMKLIRQRIGRIV